MLEQGKSVKSPPHEGGGGGGGPGAIAEVPPHAVVHGETGCAPAVHGDPRGNCPRQDHSRKPLLQPCWEQREDFSAMSNPITQPQGTGVDILLSFPLTYSMRNSQLKKLKQLLLTTFQN